MSVLIKGMEMPKRCEDCMCYRREISHAYCTISSVNVLGHGNARLDNCPLVELPEHGDLLSRKALFDEAYKVWGVEYDASACNTLMDLINDAPAVVPAEREEPHD